MAKKKSCMKCGGLMPKLGSWAFIFGIIIAIVAGFWPLSKTIVSVLIVLGLLVGLLNITAKETMPYLFTALVLVIMANFGGNVLQTVQVAGPYMARMLSALVIFVIPATLLVALKAFYALAYEK